MRSRAKKGVGHTVPAKARVNRQGAKQHSISIRAMHRRAAERLKNEQAKQLSRLIKASTGFAPSSVVPIPSSRGLKKRVSPNSQRLSARDRSPERNGAPAPLSGCSLEKLGSARSFGRQRSLSSFLDWVPLKSLYFLSV